MQRSTSKRDKAILLTLLDTGLRAGELCALRVGEVDMKTGKIRIRPGDAGKAKEERGGLCIWESLLADSSGAISLSARMGKIRMLRFSWESLTGHSTGMH